MVTLTGPMKSLKTGSGLRYATCWQVERTDAVVIRVTDHNSNLTVNGEVFSATAGFSTSARERDANFQERNAEIVGFINSNFITEEDLRAGRYQDAKITEYVVDWMVPWAGVYSSTVYYLKETTFTGEIWQAQVVGLTGKIGRPRGDLYSRLCRWDLGQSFGTTKPGCHVDLAALAIAGDVTQVTTQRRAFKTSLTQAQGYFSRGILTWTSGDNIGIANEVQSYKLLDGKIVLFLDTPFDIAVGDDFSVVPGCDKLHSTCIAKFNNILNFGGFFPPGTDRMIRVPAPK